MCQGFTCIFEFDRFAPLLHTVLLDSILQTKFVFNIFRLLNSLIGNGVGDACEKDFDGDKVYDDVDNCPNNSKIFRTDFR